VTGTLEEASDLIVAGLIGYEALAAATQKVRWLPSLPLLSTVLIKGSRPARWAFVAFVAATLAVHLELAP